MSCEIEKRCVSESASEEHQLLCETESVCCAKLRIERERITEKHRVLWLRGRGEREREKNREEPRKGNGGACKKGVCGCGLLKP